MVLEKTSDLILVMGVERRLFFLVIWLLIDHTCVYLYCIHNDDSIISIFVDMYYLDQLIES